MNTQAQSIFNSINAKIFFECECGSRLFDDAPAYELVEAEEHRLCRDCWLAECQRIDAEIDAEQAEKNVETRLELDPEFVLECDRRLAQSIAHQEWSCAKAAAAEWLRVVEFTVTMAAAS